jgi:hypothetical protein
MQGCARPEAVMSRARQSLCGVYLACAVIALIGTWRQNLAFQHEQGLSLSETFVQFWPALLANRATVSITVDIFMLGLAVVVWMVLEARRLAMRGVWLYVLFGFLVAISVTVPLFLFARERRLAALADVASEPKPTAGDVLGLFVLSAGMVGFTVWCTFR